MHEAHISNGKMFVRGGEKNTPAAIQCELHECEAMFESFPIFVTFSDIHYDGSYIFMHQWINAILLISVFSLIFWFFHKAVRIAMNLLNCFGFILSWLVYFNIEK